MDEHVLASIFRSVHRTSVAPLLHGRESRWQMRLWSIRIVSLNHKKLYARRNTYACQSIFKILHRESGGRHRNLRATSSLTIVRTYRDEGESGLRIKHRLGLTQLINDVQSGSADFSHVLVFDVSRWGRFQDVDESAHYEFICKQADIKVAYCAEQFDNDGSLISHFIKNMKRVVAAEFSRQLSAKVHAGQ